MRGLQLESRARESGPGPKAALPLRGRPGTRVAALGLLGSLLIAASAGASPAPADTAVLTARFDPEKRTVSGTAEFSFVNRTSRPLEEILVNVYPNRLLRPNPALNDVNYSWSYPRSFDPGYMDVTKLRVEGGGARAASAAFVKREKRPHKTLLSVALASPLPPGARATVRMEFTTFVPRKYGTFGRYDGAYLLNGGWYPYLPQLDPEAGWVADALPPGTRFRLALERPADFEAVVNGTRYRRGEPVRFEAEARFLTLALAETFHEYSASSEGATVTYLRLDSSEGSGKRVSSEAAQVLSFYNERFGPVKGVRIVLMEGHFRTVLTEHGDGVGLTSDRILRVLPYPVDLRVYHLREVAFEVLYMLAARETRRREEARDWNWVAEAVAWARLRQYLSWRDRAFDEVSDILNTFRFIPIIDQTVVAPRFPFNDVFFDTFFKTESSREGVLRYNNKTPFGRLMVEKARDVMGDEALARALDLWAEGRRMEEALTEAGGGDMEGFVAQWRGGYPRMNYRVGKVREKKLGEGRYRITAEIFRTGGGAFKEIAELGVVCESGRRFLARIPIQEGRTLDDWIYPEPWDKVIVDPRNRIRETNKTDNRVPRKPRILVTAFNPRLEWELENPLSDSKLDLELYGGFAGILEGDYSNQVHLTYFYNRRGVGSSLGYYRAFNMKLDRTDFRQGVGAFFFLERLHKDFALADGAETVEEENLVVTSFLLYYTVDTRLDRKNPHNGAAARISFEMAEMVFGTDFSFKRLFWNLRWIHAPIREHILAFQAEGGLSWGRVPAQRRFSAGGFFGVRGVPEREALGTQSLVFRWEYRHMVWHDLNLNFFWFGWIRKVQGVLFMETGIVEERPENLFCPSRFRSGTGYGFRIEFDSFGVRPFLVGIDVGWRLDEIGDPPIFYLTVSQSF